VIKKVIRIFKRCVDCPFCLDNHMKDVIGYHVKYVCLRSEYKEIYTKELLTFPDWCPLKDETVVDLTKLKVRSNP
jgi:hypothetical protein